MHPHVLELKRSGGARAAGLAAFAAALALAASISFDGGVSSAAAADGCGYPFSSGTARQKAAFNEPRC